MVLAVGNAGATGWLALVWFEERGLIANWLWKSSYVDRNPKACPRSYFLRSNGRSYLPVADAGVPGLLVARCWVHDAKTHGILAKLTSPPLQTLLLVAGHTSLVYSAAVISLATATLVQYFVSALPGRGLRETSPFVKKML